MVQDTTRLFRGTGKVIIWADHLTMNLLKPPCDEAVIATQKAAAPCTKEHGRWILAATILGSSMVFIDGTVVNIALPALQANLNATAVDVQWVVESYVLFLAALLLLGGSLGDHFGRRRIYSIGVVLFALASIWCGLAPNISQLILARAVQGIGGALLVPGRSGDHQRILSRGRAWTGDRNLVRLDCDHHRFGSGFGRMADRTCFLARGFLPESPAGNRRSGAGLLFCSRKPQ
jgi:hypothetical protein